MRERFGAKFCSLQRQIQRLSDPLPDWRLSRTKSVFSGVFRRTTEPASLPGTRMLAAAAKYSGCAVHRRRDASIQRRRQQSMG